MLAPLHPRVQWKVDLFDDVIASICDAAVAAPEAIGYAGIAGLPGTAGLYSVFIGPIAYALVSRIRNKMKQQANMNDENWTA